MPALRDARPLLLCSAAFTLVLAQACSPTDGADPATHPTATTAAENTGHVQPPDTYAGELPLDLLRVPEGYAVDVFADGLTNARSMAYAGDGLVFVGTRNEGSVYAALDRDGDLRADTTYVLATGMNMPNGVALRGDDLYVATVDTVWRWRGIRARLADPGAPEVVYGGYPSEKHHGWKFIRFGPDGQLYVPVGAPCNICDEEGYATITRLDVDAAAPAPEVVARGVRNSVGFTWHPATGELWFTDNGRDMLGDDVPPCELNRLTADGPAHFGYPYVHGGTLPDPEFGAGRDPADYAAPAQNLGPHVAPLGVEFAAADGTFGAELAGHALIAEHGSWNRTEPIGYRLTRVPVDAAGEPGGAYEVFIDGWLQDDGPWGRPVDLEWLPDGSLLVSDDFAGAIYRVYREA